MPKYPKSEQDPHDWREQHNGNTYVRLRCTKCGAIGFKNTHTGIITTFADGCKK